MSGTLKVEHFGPIREAELELKKTTVLIGPQGSGKSTLAKLVGICKDKQFIFNETFYSLKVNHFTGMLRLFSLENYISEKSSFLFSTQDYNLRFFNNYLTPNLSEKKIAVLGQLIEDGDNTINYRGIPINLDNLKRKYSNYDGTFHSRIILNPYYKRVIDSFLGKMMYIPTERFFISSTSGSQWGLIANNIALPRIIPFFGNEFELSRQYINDFKLDFLGIYYRYVNGEDRIYFQDENFVKLSESASGYQAIIPLVVVIEHLNSHEKNHFIIEEPELNLYPTTQKDLIYYLANRCAKGENELLMTTHSPYVLSALNNLLFAYQVAKKFPEKAGEVAKIIPQESWLNPEEFAAYYVGDGTVRSIVNPKTGMISENELDIVSELIGEEFDRLMDIYRTTIHA